MADSYAMPGAGYMLGAIAMMVLMTQAIRFAPFLVFRQHTPKVILYLGNVLPEAVMAMLVIYCLKHVSLFGGSHGLPEFIAIALVVFLHKWKHNTLLSILGGTLVYMFLVQSVFA